MNIEEVLPGMKTIPEYYGTERWELLLGGAWVALCNHALGQLEHRAAFEKETGHSLSALVGRSPFDAMIDKATGRDSAVMAAWCDWVTTNLWGEAKQAERVRGTPPPSALEDPIGWRKWWMACNPGKTWDDASAAWKREAL